ncbi:hypothetical protein JVU11DRAFT_4921 [Chiua virens]|nr:hypothetical protein JVU11DRAFT_4921 [Chiua virens]
MSSIQNLLNPEERISSACERAPAGQKWEVPISSESTSDTNTNPTVPSESRLPETSKDGDHEQHPNCPDTLACLPDTDGRPQHTLPVILRCAILGSAKKRLTIREIYAAMENKYTYFRNAGPTWKQSVRHHLSLNRLFERQPRPATDPGFGSYWTVNLSAPPGTKRPRKRGRTSKAVSSGPSPIDLTQSNQQKKRGRPRKPLGPSDSFASPPPVTPGTASSTRTFDHDSEESVERQDSSHECNASEDEYESEEDMVIPRNCDPSVIWS